MFKGIRWFYVTRVTGGIDLQVESVIGDKALETLFVLLIELFCNRLLS